MRTVCHKKKSICIHASRVCDDHFVTIFFFLGTTIPTWRVVTRQHVYVHLEYVMIISSRITPFYVHRLAHSIAFFDYVICYLYFSLCVLDLTIKLAGGFLQKIRTSLVYLCPAEHIPPKIEVDLTNLDVGDRVLMHDIPVHPSLKLLSKNETMPVCKILASKPDE